MEGGAKCNTSENYIRKREKSDLPEILFFYLDENNRVEEICYLFQKLFDKLNNNSKMFSILAAFKPFSFVVFPSPTPLAKK